MSNNSALRAKEEHVVKTLFSWKAKARPFRKKHKESYVILAFITLCCVIVAMLFNEIGLIMAILAVAFLTVVLSVSEPVTVEHRITTQGIITGEHTYLFKELYDFWFTEKHWQITLHIRTEAFFPGMLSLLIHKEDKDKIRDILVKYIPFREVVDKTFVDRAGNWLSDTFPLDS